MRHLIAIAIFALCAAIARAEVYLGTVRWVVDGGVITLWDNGGLLREVRLCGVDPPTPAEPAAASAQDYLASLVNGKKVRVEVVGEDDYGRTVGKVWVQPLDCPDCGMTLDVNLAMVTAGMVRWQRSDAPLQSAEDRGRYESAELEARARGWGLWQQQADIPPP